jgi:hypothetical protein
MEDTTSAYLPTCVAIVERLGIAHAAYVEAVNNPSAFTASYDCERAALQLRLICELLLLGSTASHILDGGVEVTDTEWRPKNSFHNLRQFSEHPLPLPVSVHYDKNGPGQHHIEPLSKPIDFGRLSQIYGICGDLLHVPTLRQVLHDRKPEFDLDRLGRWLKGVGELMRAHTLMLPERKIILLCIWSGVPGESPSVYRMDAQGESVFDMSSYPDFSLF